MKIFNYLDMKRFALTFILVMLLGITLLPLCSEHLLTGFLRSRYINTHMRVDLCMRGSSSDSLEITSKNNYLIAGWDKINNTSVVEDDISAEWDDCTISARAKHDGELEICLRGPYIKIDGEVCPVLVDYRELKINGKIIFAEPREFWHNEAFRYKVRLQEKENINITFAARKHHFKIDDFERYFHVNWGMLAAIAAGLLLIGFILPGYAVRAFKTRTDRLSLAQCVVLFAIWAAATAWGMFMCRSWYVAPGGEWKLYNFVFLTILVGMTCYSLRKALIVNSYYPPDKLISLIRSVFHVRI